MSHIATSWLASLDPAIVSASEFRVLFHLCDCHNPSKGCFPSQEYLRRHAAVSNGTVNNALNSLEEKGLLERVKRFDEKTRRQRSTHYILGFEIERSQAPTPNIGDGAVSKSDAEPSPKNGQSRLQPIGDKPVKEPLKNHARGEKAKPSDAAIKWAERIKAGKYASPAVVGIALANEMLHFGLIGEGTLRARGIIY